MADHPADPNLDRLLRHMAWANAALIARLTALPDSALELASPNNEWTAGRILDHLVSAAGGYATRLEGGARMAKAEPTTSTTQLPALAERLAGFDARLRAQGALPEGTAGYAGDPPEKMSNRSTVVAQAIHHATEHRAQIAGALSTNGVDAIDLDAIDLWEHEDAEGRAPALAADSDS
jgi:uncharacterized damage-inducible protein DinB